MAGANVIPVIQKAVATPVPPAAVPPPIRPTAVTIPATPKPPAPIVPPQPDAARVAPNAGDGMRRDQTTWMGTKGQPVPSSWFFSMHDRARLVHAEATVALAVAIFLLMVIATGLLLLPSSGTKTTEATLYPFVDWSTTTKTPAPTASPATTKSTLASPRIESTKKVRVTTPSTTTTKRYQFTTPPLICVYGSGFNNTLEFPEEGLCDLTVFDSLYKDHRNPWPKPDNDLLHFLSGARTHRKSQFGLSFDFKNWRNLSEELSNGNPVENIDDYWFDRIYHYGMVDISPYGDTEVEVARTVALFETLYKLLEKKSYESGLGQHTLIFFGFSPLNQKWISFVPSLFATFRPHVFVIRGHYSLVNHNAPDCRIVAPTFQSRTAGTYFSLHNAHAALKFVNTRDPGGATSLSLSVSMQGRWNRPKAYLQHEASKYGFLEPCIKLPAGVQQFGNVYEICSQPSYQAVYDKAYKAEYRYNFAEGLSFTYDTLQSLREKLCYYKTNLTSVPYGLALFDMQYEDWIGFCFSEKFARLRALRKLQDFITQRFRFASDFTDCLFSTRAA